MARPKLEVFSRSLVRRRRRRRNAQTTAQERCRQRRRRRRQITWAKERLPDDDAKNGMAAKIKKWLQKRRGDLLIPPHCSDRDRARPTATEEPLHQRGTSAMTKCPTHSILAIETVPKATLPSSSSSSSSSSAAFVSVVSLMAA